MKSEKETRQEWTRLNNGLIKAGFKKELLDNSSKLYRYSRTIVSEDKEHEILQYIDIFKGLMFETTFINEIYFDINTKERDYDTIIRTKDIIKF